MYARGVVLHGPSEHYPRPDAECEPQCTRDRLVILSRCFGCAAAHPTMRACMRRSMATWPVPTVCLPRSTSMGHRCRIASRAGHTDEQACMCQSSRSWMWRRKSWVQRALLVVAHAACSTLQAERKHFDHEALGDEEEEPARNNVQNNPVTWRTNICQRI